MERHRLRHQPALRRGRRRAASVVLLGLALLAAVLLAGHPSVSVTEGGEGLVVGEPGSGSLDSGASEPTGSGSSENGASGISGSGVSPTSGYAETLEGRAEVVLTSYQGASDCVLAYAGYLDLLGDVWTCVVVGDGWSEICLVSEGDDDGVASVRVVRIEGAGLDVSVTEG